MSKTIITVGSDPEFFLIHKTVRELVPSIGKIGGTKYEPITLPQGVKVHEDNVAVEVDVKPSSSADEFVSNVHKSISAILESYPDFELSDVASHIFDEEELKKLPGAFEAGCEPDFDAFTGETNQFCGFQSGLRCAGGHVHLAYEGHNFRSNIEAVMLFNIYLGVPSIILDQDKRRRELYGKASCYRTKEYGLEYRTLSNFWLFKDSYIRWVFNACEKIADNIVNKKPMPEYEDIVEAITIINSQDAETAKKFIERLEIEMPDE